MLEYTSPHILYMIGCGVRCQRNLELCGSELELKPDAKGSKWKANELIQVALVWIKPRRSQKRKSRSSREPSLRLQQRPPETQEKPKTFSKGKRMKLVSLLSALVGECENLRQAT